MKRLPQLLVVLLILAALLSACAGTNASPTPTSTAAQPSIADDLPDTEYLLEATQNGTAPLQEGYYEESSAPDSAAKTQVQLGREQALGDVNGDGLEDAAVTLVVDPGGSGTFTYLALVLNQDGSASPLPAVLLGDRIIVQSIAIQPGSVTVQLLTRGADEPMSAVPTVDQQLTFDLQDGQLAPETQP